MMRGKKRVFMISATKVVMISDTACRIFNSKHTHSEIAAATTKILNDFELGDETVKSGSVTKMYEEEEEDMESFLEDVGIESDDDDE